MQLTREQTEFATACLIQLVESRQLNQTQLQHCSGVAQSTISKILSRTLEPTPETLKKLFQALGLKLHDILHEVEATPTELLGYLASPLTGVVQSQHQEDELRRTIDVIKSIATGPDFTLEPTFELYWPGDHTHPLRHAQFTAPQVYLTDRSRASTYDFLIMLCASPSYGVGQENEIATQSGLPAIRLVPKVLSRMMGGSFLRAWDVQYSGSLDTQIQFDAADLISALKDVRRLYFAHRALYRVLNGDGFGKRLETLVSDRRGDKQKFAEDLGVNATYVETMMKEPIRVSNPSVYLLKRMAVMLGVSVGYLLGETADSDPVMMQSLASWRSWLDATPGLDASLAMTLRDEWKDEYLRDRRQPSGDT